MTEPQEHGAAIPESFACSSDDIDESGGLRDEPGSPAAVTAEAASPTERADTSDA